MKAEQSILDEPAKLSLPTNVFRWAVLTDLNRYKLSIIFGVNASHQHPIIQKIVPVDYSFLILLSVG